MTYRIIVEKCAGKEILKFHLSIDLGRFCEFKRPLREGEGNWNLLNSQTQDLIRKFLEIPGIVRVTKEVYSVQFERGLAFPKSDLVAKILSAFKEVYGENPEIVNEGDSLPEPAIIPS